MIENFISASRSHIYSYYSLLSFLELPYLAGTLFAMHGLPVRPGNELKAETYNELRLCLFRLFGTFPVTLTLFLHYFCHLGLRVRDRRYLVLLGI